MSFTNTVLPTEQRDIIKIIDANTDDIDEIDDIDKIDDKENTNPTPRRTTKRKRVEGPNQPINYHALIMSMTSDPIAREIASPFCVKALELTEQHDEFEDPLSSNRSQLELERITNRACVYVVLDARTKKVLKVGYSGRYRDRLKYYEEGGTFVGEDCIFRRVFDFDNVSAAYYKEAEQIYKDMMNTLISSDRLHSFQHQQFEALFTYKGDELGPKRSIMLAMVEYGLQKKYKVAAPAEFLMFDKEVMDYVYELIESDADFLFDTLSFLFEDENGEELGVDGISSWNTASNGLSSNIMTLQAILGKARSGNWRDTLPYPACPNARTAEEVFSKNYSDRDKRSGRNEITEANKRGIRRHASWIRVELSLRNQTTIWKQAASWLPVAFFTWYDLRILVYTQMFFFFHSMNIASKVTALVNTTSRVQ